jgi:hypothetical protein
MNRFAAGGLAAALTALTATAAGPTAADSRSWTDRILGKKAETKPVESPKAATPLRPPIIIAPLPADVLAEAVKDEQTACTRRLDACAKLREIAQEKNDEALLRRIDEIEKQAVEICQARVARMGIRGDAARTVRARPPEKTVPFDPASVAPPAPVAGGSK